MSLKLQNHLLVVQDMHFLIGYELNREKIESANNGDDLESPESIITYLYRKEVNVEPYPIVLQVQDEELLVGYDPDDRSIAMWNMRTTEVTKKFDVPNGLKQCGHVLRKNSRVYASFTNDKGEGILACWKMSDNNLLFQRVVFPEEICEISVSGADIYISSVRKTVQVVSGLTGCIKSQYSDLQGYELSVNRNIGIVGVYASQSDIQIYNLKGRPLFQIEHSFHRFLRNWYILGEVIITVSVTTVFIWSLKTGQLQYKLQHPSLFLDTKHQVSVGYEHLIVGSLEKLFVLKF